jgi:alpha-mannosidase
MNITRDDPTKIKAVPWSRGGKNPQEVSYISISDPKLVVSALRRSQDGNGLIFRFYNITGESVAAEVKSYRVLSKVWLVNLNEERQGEIPILDANTFEVRINGHQIATYELQPAAF